MKKSLKLTVNYMYLIIEDEMINKPYNVKLVKMGQFWDKEYLKTSTKQEITKALAGFQLRMYGSQA